MKVLADLSGMRCKRDYKVVEADNTVDDFKNGCLTCRKCGITQAEMKEKDGKFYVCSKSKNKQKLDDEKQDPDRDENKNEREEENKKDGDDGDGDENEDDEECDCHYPICSECNKLAYYYYVLTECDEQMFQDAMEKHEDDEEFLGKVGCWCLSFLLCFLACLDFGCCFCVLFVCLFVFAT